MILPRQGLHRLSSKPDQILFLCFYDPKNPGIEISTIGLLQQHSVFPIIVLNLYEHGSIKKTISFPDTIYLNCFSVIIIHQSLLNPPQNTAIFKDFFKKFNGIKILMCTEKMISDERQFDLIFKCNTNENDIITKTQLLLEKELTILLKRKKQLSTQPIFSSQKPTINVLLLAAHDPVQDPRLDWVAKHAPSPINIIQAGVANNKCILIGDSIAISQNQQPWKKGFFNRYFSQMNSTNSAGITAIQELIFLENLMALSEKNFCATLGAPLNDKRNNILYWYFNYILTTTALLLQQSTTISGLHAIIATDLPTLPTALILKSLFNIPVLYDAHEYWPEADVESYEYEKQFWTGMEQRLVTHADYCQTVSTGLATIMTTAYHKVFGVLPNCLPLNDILSSCPNRSNINATHSCRFLYQGNFAPARGIDLLIQAWPKTNHRAILMLRGPDSIYKAELQKMAKKSGLLDKRIVFLPPVQEQDLITALSDGDVGVISYTPFGNNYTHCSPNKLAQYMAAKLPILANDTTYIKTILTEANAGIVTDFSSPKNLIDAVNEFTHHMNLRVNLGENGYQYSKNHFNWDNLSKPFYEQIIALTTEKQASPINIWPTHPKQQFYTLYNRLIAARTPIIRSFINIVILKKIKRFIYKTII